MPLASREHAAAAGNNVNRDAGSPCETQDCVTESGSITSAHASVGAAAIWPTTGTALMAPEVIRQGAAATPQPLNPTAIRSSHQTLICLTTTLGGLGSNRVGTGSAGADGEPRGIGRRGESDRAYGTTSPRAATTRDSALRQSG